MGYGTSLAGSSVVDCSGKKLSQNAFRLYLSYWLKVLAVLLYLY
jgi:hypothetical protein